MSDTKGSSNIEYGKLGSIIVPEAPVVVQAPLESAVSDSNMYRMMPGSVGPSLVDIVIPSPQDVKDRPTVSLFVLAKNAESCILRLLDNVGPYIDEVVMVLNDTTDSTKEIVGQFCKENNKELIIEEVTAATHPELYILDTKATYSVGRSLCGEEFEGPYTEGPILANWSAARNLGWNKCTKEWRLFMDADDLMLDPQAIPGLCRILNDYEAEQANSSYHYSADQVGRAKGSSYRERLAKNVPSIQWIFPIHEVLDGAVRITHIQGNLIARDMRDNTGAGTRIPGRNFKILYHQARDNDWNVSPRTLVNLIMEVRHMIEGGETMMKFAEELLRLYLERSTWPEERGWACCIVAEMFERMESPDKAIELYKQSLDEHPGTKSAWLLCRTLFPVGRWQECIDAYQLGVENKEAHQVLNDGPLLEEMTKILVVGCYMELKNFKMAKSFHDQLLVSFPGTAAILEMGERIDAALAAEPEAKAEVDAS